MKEDKKVPQLRFPEFTDAWKQRKFGDVLVSIQTGTNKLGSDRNSGQPLLKMGNLQSGYFDLSKLEFLENKAEPENIVKQGDFFFNTRNTLELVGKGATWFGESNKYAFNSNIARFTLKDINTGFFNYLYNTNYVKKQIRARAMGTTSVAAIYPRSLKSVDIVIPNMEEQIKLSNLFMNLDSTITLQQRKLNSLQKLKKGLLQKMFPKNGENIPEIRFPEFSDAWKQRKFGEFVERKSDSALSSTSIPSVEYENVESETGILKKDIYVKTEFKKGVLFSDKDVLYGKLRPYLHNWLAPSFTGVAVGDWWVLSPKNCSKDFLYRLLQTLTFDEIANQTSGTKMPRADWNLVSSTAFYIPSSIEEQAKIGSLFNRIDSTITLQQRWLFYTHKQS